MSEILIRRVSRVGWVWLGVFVVSGTVIQGIAVQLPNPTWFVLPGVSVSAASVHPFVPVGLLLLSWSSVLVFIAWSFVNNAATRPGRPWPMVVLIMLGVLGAVFFGSLVTGGILLLGHTSAISAAAARSLLVVPCETVAGVALAVSLVSLAVVPVVIELRRRRRGRP